MIRFALAAALLAAPVAAETDTIAHVQAHLRALTTMTASFTQTDRNGKVLTGTITLKQPGRIRFQYQQGVPLLIVGDGKALTMIDYQVNQVSRWPVGNSPLGLLLDPSKDVGHVAQIVPGTASGHIAIQGRDPKHPEFGTITIAFEAKAGAPAGLMLDGWTVLDAQGNRTTTLLSDQKFGMAVDDKAFQWRDPRPHKAGR